MMVVWQPLVSVKEEPKEYIQQTDEMLYGDTCEILEEAGEYVKIRSDYGYEGYVLREALTELTVEPNAMVSVPFGDFLPQAMNWYAPVSVLPGCTWRITPTVPATAWERCTGERICTSIRTICGKFPPGKAPRRSFARGS